MPQITPSIIKLCSVRCALLDIRIKNAHGFSVSPCAFVYWCMLTLCFCNLASTGECEVDVVADVVLAQELFEVVATEHGLDGGVDT